jgi:hypothetical protein
MSVETDGEDVSICVGCGLCCDGTVVSHLALQDESDLGMPLRALGVEVIVAADPPVFALPCPAVSEGRCTIHHLHRPHACHEFECAVSTVVAGGTMTRAEARSIIVSTVEMRELVRTGEVAGSVLDEHLDRSFRS